MTTTSTPTTTICARCRHFYAYPERLAGLCGIRDHADGQPHESKANSSCGKWKARPVKAEVQA